MSRTKLLIYTLAFVALSAGIVRAGQMSLQTYYPAPQGYYNQLYAQKNIGVGTIAPLTVMQVNTNDNDSADGVGIYGSDGHSLLLAPSLGIGSYNPIVQNGDGGFIYSNGTQNQGNFVIAPWSAGTSGIRMDSNGNVGIGSTNPNAMLDIHGGSNGDIVLGNDGGCGPGYSAIGFYGTFPPSSNLAHCTEFALMSNGANLYINRPTTSSTGSGNIYFDYGGISAADTQMVLNSNGNLIANNGIFTSGNISSATTSYLYPLYGGSPEIFVNGDNHAGGGIALSDDGGFYDWNDGYIAFNGSNGLRIAGNSGKGSGGNALYVDDGTINVNGYGGVWGTGSYTSPNQQLSINGNQIWESVGPTVYLQYSSGGDVEVGSTGSNSNFTVYGNVGIGQAASTTYNLNVPGSAYIGTVYYQNQVTPSDQILKQNIMPLTGALAKLDQLHGVSFEWNHLASSIGLKEGQKNIGMIAQDLQKVYPQLVMPMKRGNKEYLSIDYTKFSAVLLQSIKELKAQVDSMQDQINTLQTKVNTLEKQK